MASVSKSVIQDKLASMYKSNKEAIIIFGLKVAFGGGRSTGFALVYDTVDAARKFEPKHRLVRMGIVKVDPNAIKQSRKQRKEKKNRAKKVRGTQKHKKATAGKK